MNPETAWLRYRRGMIVRPLGVKLFDRGLMAAHRTTAVNGQPAELWAIREPFQEDPQFLDCFAGGIEFIRRRVAPAEVDEAITYGL